MGLIQIDEEELRRIAEEIGDTPGYDEALRRAEEFRKAGGEPVLVYDPDDPMTIWVTHKAALYRRLN